MAKQIVITGIGTDVGKTVVSAILCEAHKCSYWKPVQAGDLNYTDSNKISSWCSNEVTVLPEKHRLKTPASPHLAAALDQVSIEHLNLEDHPNELFIEGAGGLMVPLNDSGLLYVDQFASWNLPLVLVSRHYLGSINHTLLSLEAIKSRGLQLAALIWVGDENPGTEKIVESIHPEIKTHRIPWGEEVNAEFIQREAKRIPWNLFKK
ncbi:MAG: dethiobiotin synthase [Bacteroidetes bacterium]|nr:MAG: dethiobiotin synthase [Bacteroidota bacterium]